MIYLIRVYKDDRVVFAEAYDKDEPLPQKPHPIGCRCPNIMSWSERLDMLAHKHGLGRRVGRHGSDTYEHGKVTYDAIYPTPQKRN